VSDAGLRDFCGLEPRAIPTQLTGKTVDGVAEVSMMDFHFTHSRLAGLASQPVL
jgi:hypothetical protein